MVFPLGDGYELLLREACFHFPSRLMFAQAKRQMELKDVIEHVAPSLRALSVSINSSDHMQDKNPSDAIPLQLAPHVFDRTIDSKTVSQKTLYATWTLRKVGSFFRSLETNRLQLRFRMTRDE